MGRGGANGFPPGRLDRSPRPVRVNLQPDGSMGFAKEAHELVLPDADGQLRIVELESPASLTNRLHVVGAGRERDEADVWLVGVIKRKIL